MSKFTKLCPIAVCAVIVLTLTCIMCAAQVPSAEDSSDFEGSFLLIGAEVPLYPQIARIARISGNVDLHVSVKKGKVVNVEAQSSAAAVLLEAAKRNVKTWKFEQDTNGSFNVHYIYDLENQESVIPQNPHIEMRLPFYIRITGIPVIRNTIYGRKQCSGKERDEETIL